MSRVYQLSIFNINADIVQRYLFSENSCKCHQHAIVPVTVAKEVDWTSVSSHGWTIFFVVFRKSYLIFKF